MRVAQKVTLVLALSVLVCANWVVSVSAQERVPVYGRIVDVEDAALSGAAVHALGTYWSTLSRVDGSFEIALPSGTWPLRVDRIGYRPDTVSVTVGADMSPPPFVVRLSPQPISLRGLTVEAARTPPLGHTVTTETVRQVPPLGEPDIFRALVLLPGVSQPNDLKGRIHLAGGSSDETGIRLDGHPLQDPFHLLGLFGAFNIATLERADVLIHHLPAGLGGRLSGVIDLTTRYPEGDPTGEVVASLLTSGATLSYPDLPGGLDLLASGRITYLDRVMPLFFEDFPGLGFHDALLRLGHSWGDGWRAEAIGFTTRDYLRDADLVDLVAYEPFTWGESLAGFSVNRASHAWDFSARASFNRAFTHLDERALGGTNFIDSGRDWAAGAAEMTRTERDWLVTGGISLDHRVNGQEWIARGLANEIFSPSTPEVFAGEETQTVWAAFGEGSHDIGERWTASAGLRLSGLGGEIYPAPRATLAFQPTDELRVEAAIDRRHQFDAQLEEPLEGSITAPLFLLDEPRTANVAAVSAEWKPARIPIGRTGSVQVQAFYKQYPDRPRLPALDPEETRGKLDLGFPDFHRFPGHALGAMASGKLTFGDEGILQGSYTYQRVREEFDGEIFPTAWDAPHTVALFGSVPTWSGWTLNTVYHAHSGRATTPVLNRIFEPDLRFANSRFLLARYLYGERNSIRVPPYHRLDIGTRRSWNARDAEWTLSLQILNVFNNENPVGYDWRVYFGDLVGRDAAPRAGRIGLPVMPSIGLEVKW
jgi:hypothetical protein